MHLLNLVHQSGAGAQQPRFASASVLLLLPGEAFVQTLTACYCPCCLPFVCLQCLVCCFHTIVLLLQASDGTTTMAQQLPKALQQLVQDKVSCDRVPDAYRVIAVAQKQQLQQQQAVVKAQRQQLKRQQTVVKAQQQQLEQQEQLQGENVQLRQEVGDLQARLVAALEQLGSQEGPMPS